MNALLVHLFGGVHATLHGRPLGSFPTRWAAGLFAYLALHKGRLVHRDVLTGLFWPEETDQRARKALRNALWRVRSLIEPEDAEPGSILTVDGQCVGLRDDGTISLDVAEFDAHLASARTAESEEEGLTCLERCVTLYRGDFMDGYDHEWCVYERERLRLGLLAALERLMEVQMRRGDWTSAIRWGSITLHHDPLRENIHRRLMMCHYCMGDRPLAVRRYRECVRILREELGIAPMEATQRLHRQIEDDSLGADGGPPPGTPDSWPNSRLRRALTEAEAALSELRRLAG